MADKSTLVRDDDYDEIAATYQCIMVSVLDQALGEAGIADARKRRDICRKFAFALGNFHDQYWFEVNGKRFYPLLCFSEKFLNLDTDVTKLGKIIASSSGFSFHEYADGAVDWYFNDPPKNERAEIEMGLAEEEDS